MHNKESLAIISKNREDYNRIAKYFANTRQEPWGEFLLFKPFLKNGQNILDWGCGNGRLARWVLKSFNINYFGVDQSSGLLKIAKEILQKEARLGKAKFFNSAKKGKKFPDSFFDIIFAIASFHHLPDVETRKELLNKFYRELKKGGMLFISVWNLESGWAKKKNDFKKLGKNNFLVPWKNPQGKVETERFYHSFGKLELSALVKSAGFKIKKAEYSGKTEWSDKKGGRNLVVMAEK